MLLVAWASVSVIVGMFVINSWDAYYDWRVASMSTGNSL
jgi:hypothetical protein